MSHDLNTWSHQPSVTDISENVANITGDGVSDYVSWLRRVDPVFLLYSTVIIVSLGVVGNSFSITVFVSSFKFRRLSTIQFLVALAINDSLYLIGELLFVLSGTDWEGKYLSPINFVNTNDVGCKLVMWLRYRFVSYATRL